MCFSIDHTSTKTKSKQVAKENIIVYKVGYKGKHGTVFASSVIEFEYNLNELYSLSKGTKLESNCFGTVDEGFHSYSTFKEAKHFNVNYPNEYPVKCIIPKGTKYYYNALNNQYVSDRIIIKKFVSKRTGK